MTIKELIKFLYDAGANKDCVVMFHVKGNDSDSYGYIEDVISDGKKVEITIVAEA